MLDPDYYHENSEKQLSMAEMVISTLTFSGSENVLDIGSGNGKVSKILADKIPLGHIHGIDLCAEMVRFSKEKYAQLNLTFEHLDAQRLTGSNQYDLVTSFCAFYWIKNQKLALQNIKEALKENGEIVLLVFPKDSQYNMPLLKAMEAPKFKEFGSTAQYSNMLTTTEYENVLNDLGFSRVNIAKTIEYAHYKNIKEYQDYARGWIRCFISLPEHLEEEFIALSGKHAQNDFPAGGGEGFSIPFTQLNIRARIKSL